MYTIYTQHIHRENNWTKFKAQIYLLMVFMMLDNENGSESERERQKERTEKYLLLAFT